MRASFQAFNKPQGVVSGNVTWNNTQNLTVSTANISHSKATYYCHGNSDQKINSGGTGYFKFQGKSGEAGAGLGYVGMFLMTYASAPYTSNTATISTISGYGLRLSENDGTQDVNVYKAGGTFATSFAVAGLSPSTNWQIGFDGSNHAQVWKNGVVQWTDSATTTTADYILYVVMENGGGSPGADSVTYHT